LGVLSKYVRIRIDELIQAERGNAGRGADHDPQWLRHDGGKLVARPESHHPTAADWAGQSITHSIL
jgi:hypothetical protein